MREKHESPVEEFRVLEAQGQWQFQVGIVAWPQPHTPEIRWVTFRTWKRPATESRITLAKAAARRSSRFFRTCKCCDKLKNAGHMHDPQTCQSCAEREFGIAH
ncbi:MAG: hypothetical protein JWL81_2849 [Verrucomicrobiales bacterium]|nr:hypothetical protein [Verrucomicrobiales bacterium]